MTRRKRIVLSVLGVGASLLVVGIVAALIWIRPLLTADARRENALETLAARGIDDVIVVDASFEDVTVRAYATAMVPVDAPLVVFVHGSPGDWTDFVELLADPVLRDGTRMVSVDRLGYGGSDLGDPEPSMARQAAAVISVLDALDVERAVLVGHSLGGPVVARAAMDFPERVAAIVPVGSSADPTLEETPWYQHLGAARLVRPLLPPMIDVCNREILPHRHELRAMERRWHSILCPVVILHGTDDVLVPVQNVDFMAARVRADLLTVHRVEGMNHFVPWTHPQWLREAILDAVAASGTLRAAG